MTAMKGAVCPAVAGREPRVVCSGDFQGALCGLQWRSPNSSGPEFAMGQASGTKRADIVDSDDDPEMPTHRRCDVEDEYDFAAKPPERSVEGAPNT